MHKKGDYLCIWNYKPISFLTEFSKMFKKVMNKHVMYYLNGNRILVNEVWI
jgi:hypothetical protein